MNVPLVIGGPRDPHGFCDIAEETGVTVDGPTLAPDRLLTGWETSPAVFMVGEVTAELLASYADQLPRRPAWSASPQSPLSGRFGGVW